MSTEQLLAEFEKADKPKWRKSAGKKKFLLERRWVGTNDGGFMTRSMEWHPYQRYKDEKSRAKALECLARKKCAFTGTVRWEYRIKA